MKNNIIAGFLLMLFVMVLHSCDKPVELDFTGYTPRDVNAQLMGLPDATDWQMSDAFTATELNLFIDKNNNTTCTIINPNEFMVFPNASNGIFVLNWKTSITSKIELHIVNKEFKSIYSYIGTIDSTFLKSVDINNKTSNGEFVRMYYKINNNTCEYRGHGDIKIVK
jgi:hypothetical protein